MATFAGQELFAEYAAMSVVMQYFLMRWARSLWERSFWVLGMLLMVAALFATATRGGLLVLLGGFAYLIMFGSHVVPRIQSMRIAFVAVAVFYLSLSFLEPLIALMMERILSIGPQDSSLQSRSGVMAQAFEAVLREPFIGHGISTPHGTFRGPVTINIHNLYLTLAYTIGIPGLIAFCWFLVGLWRRTWSVTRNAMLSTRSREIALAMNILLVMFMVDQIKIEYVRQPMAMHLVWLNFGFMMAAWRTAVEDSGRE